jgi:hypothetical protein
MSAMVRTSEITTYKVAGVVGAAIVVHVGDCPLRKSNVPKQNVATVQQRGALRKSWHGREVRSGCTPQARRRRSSGPMTAPTNAPWGDDRSKRVSTWNRVEQAGTSQRKRCERVGAANPVLGVVGPEPGTRESSSVKLCPLRYADVVFEFPESL